MKNGSALVASVADGQADGTRRTEILEAAASLIASSGLRTSLQEIADAAGILPGSLYHHFESKEAILIELIRRYHADLDRIGEIAQQRLRRTGLEIRFREDRRARIGDRPLRRTPSRCAAAELSRTADQRESGARRAGAAAAQRGPGGDARHAAGGPAEGLHPARHRPFHAGGPDLPDDAARRAGRDPARCRCGSGGRGAVSDPVARTRQPTAQRREAGSLERAARRRTGSSRPGATGAKPGAATRLRTFMRSHAPSSVAEGTKPPPSGTSRPRPASASAPFTD